MRGGDCFGAESSFVFFFFFSSRRRHTRLQGDWSSDVCSSDLLTVQSSGDVQICPCESSVNAPALVIGNIHRQSLKEIWHCEKLRALRASFTDRKSVV